MAQKPSTPKGTRDFGPLIMQRRNYIFGIIRKYFEIYGFKPIETPAMENLSTLLGKYGDEGDKLVFRILNSGEFLSGLPDELINSDKSREISGLISEKGLRYDLTVPFARFIVQHRNEITFPFRRYQIQPVWRADRPQKGRYREFFQCDADMIGSDSLTNEAELIKLTDEVFSELNINVNIRINNRKILAGIAETVGLPERITDITIAIDKLDKIGMDGVFKEMESKGISSESIKMISPLFEITGSNDDKIKFLEGYLKNSQIGLKGIAEMQETLRITSVLNPISEITVDLTLARGLNYYTGIIIEVVSTDVQFGSLCGGGRYDDLTSILGLDGVSGVGISFGADRIYDVLNELNKFPGSTESSTQVLVANFGENELPYAMKICKELREEGINTEIYPDAVKMKKQFSYADANKIPYVIIVGENEVINNKASIKDMTSGNQESFDRNDVVKQIKKIISN